MVLSPEFQQNRHDTRREHFPQAELQFEGHGETAFARKGHEITGKVTPDEPIATLEFGQGIAQVLVVNVFAINQFRNAPGRADLHRLGNHGICRPLIQVIGPRQNLHDAGALVHINHFNESN